MLAALQGDRHVVHMLVAPPLVVDSGLSDSILAPSPFPPSHPPPSGTVPGKACNHISWSPQGRNIVLAGFKALNGQLEFFNVDEMETMATAEHFMATDVEWDPTGEARG